ncbi:MAG TPA: type II secretion system protein GspG [Thermoanaerobaculia bacterium]|nr:type II secretion system protein GspG [Thermoanaerobaculia bacterium]
MQTILFILNLLLSFALEAGETPQTDAERARATAREMDYWRIALTARQKDYHSFPRGDLDAARTAVEPVYIDRALTHDAWGNRYRYEATENGFLLVSAGADGEFSPGTWSQAGELTSLGDDAVITHEGRTRFWKVP